MDRKDKGAVRAAKFQVGDVVGERRDVLGRWFVLSDLCMEAVNLLYQTWLVWHVEQRTADRIRQMRIEWKAYKEKKGPKPDRIDPFPQELSKKIYDAIAATVTGLNGAVTSQLIQSEKSRFMTRPATKGAWSYWQQVLLCRERLPQSTHPLPIPIKNSAYTLLLPVDAKDEYKIVCRLNRVEPTGKSTRGTSDEDTISLFARKRKMASQRVILDRIAGGDYTRCGASLAYDRNRRKWFLSVCYRLPKVDMHLDAEATAVLRPASGHPWELDLDGERPLWIGGDGKYVASVRRQLLLQRGGRHRNYRYAASANKGHGRERALGPLFRLSRRWKDFVKTANHNTTSKVVEILCDRHIGRLVYEQPTGDDRDGLYLVKAGKPKRGHDSTGWDWFQVATQLQYKCQALGIVCEIKKVESEECVTA